MIAEELTDKEIIDAQTDDGEEETSSEETEEAVPTVVDAIRAMAVLHYYLAHDFFVLIISVENHIEQAIHSTINHSIWFALTK